MLVCARVFFRERKGKLLRFLFYHYNFWDHIPNTLFSLLQCTIGLVCINSWNFLTRLIYYGWAHALNHLSSLVLVGFLGFFVNLEIFN